MLESIEGKRGLPRHKPPFPSQVGLFGRPTLINNIETVFWVREILEKGGDWFKSHGRNGRTGLRTFSVPGRVKELGVKPAPFVLSLTGYFIALHLIEALWLKRLFVSSN